MPYNVGAESVSFSGCIFSITLANQLHLNLRTRIHVAGQAQVPSQEGQSVWKESVVINKMLEAEGTGTPRYVSSEGV